MASDIARAVALAPPQMRARLKAAHLAALGRGLPRHFSYAGLDIELTEWPSVTAEGLLRVTVRASRDGQPVHTDNPYLFANPPVLDDERHEGGIAHLRELMGQAILYVADRGV